MNKVRHLLTLLIIFFSLIIIDEGKAIILASNNIQFHLDQNQKSEIEIPYQYCFNGTDVDVTWISSNSSLQAFSSGKLLFFSSYSPKRTVDFAEFVWQPPESI